jgi:hypothetical protein
MGIKIATQKLLENKGNTENREGKKEKRRIQGTTSC